MDAPPLKVRALPAEPLIWLQNELAPRFISSEPMVTGALSVTARLALAGTPMMARAAGPLGTAALLQLPAMFHSASPPGTNTGSPGRAAASTVRLSNRLLPAMPPAPWAKVMRSPKRGLLLAAANARKSSVATTGSASGTVRVVHGI